MTKLHGIIPLTFANGNSLRNLNLNGNQLGGLLPQSLLICEKLEVLDVGNNKINDTLPLLQVLILRSIRFHGSIHNFKIAFPFQKLRIMDLSDNEFNDLSKNKFEGEIPRLVGKLKSLKGLSFPHNKLTGSIPLTFGNLTNIEWLDLSSNVLVGEIPQQLTSMISLLVLNLSRNRVVGPVPRGKQFNTFKNNSYNENLGLCVFPL
nr:receptor-like protein 33 [Ziziphus jujuba var. spinosa]